MRKFIFLFFYFFIVLQVNAFTKFIVGKVISGDVGEPLPYVNIYIKNTTIGVISNEEGNFEISIPDSQTNNVLVFSLVGYNTLEVGIPSFQNNSFITIELKENAVKLEEVILIAKTESAEEIVKKAFNRYYENFPDKPFLAQAFIRHTEKTKKEYKWLVEAAIEVYDPGFDRPSDRVLTNIIQVRNSLDNRHLDTLSVYKWYLDLKKGYSFKKAWKKTENLEGVPNTEILEAIAYYDNYFTVRGWKETFFESIFSTDHNKIRYYKNPNATFDNQILKKHRFKLDSVLYQDSITIYKIKILPTNPPAFLNRFKKDRELPVGWFYIRSKDYAIIETMYTLIVNEKKSRIGTKINGSKVVSMYNIKFSEFEGKMYPKFMSLMSSKLNRFMEVLATDNDSNINDSEIHYYTKEEIIFNNIILNENEVKTKLSKFKEDNIFRKHVYNERFWENYNILLESGQQLQLIEDLEKKVKLKEQFKQAQ